MRKSRSNFAQGASLTNHKTEDIIDCRKSVKFSSVEVRYYNRILGDNPACSMGPPLAIGWEYSEEQVMLIDQYEAERILSKSPIHLTLTPAMRRNILHSQCGCTYSEMDNMNEEIEKIRKSRARSTTTLHPKQRDLNWKLREIKKLEKVAGINNTSRFKRCKKFCNLTPSETLTLNQRCSHMKKVIARVRTCGF